MALRDALIGGINVRRDRWRVEVISDTSGFLWSQSWGAPDGFGSLSRDLQWFFIYDDWLEMLNMNRRGVSEGSMRA